MNKVHTHSLGFRLTTRLVLWQILTLAAFVVVVSVPASRSGDIVLDEAVVADIADTLAINDEGLVVGDTARINALRQDHPGLWFYVSGPAGQTLSVGPIPETFLPAREYVPFVSSGNVGNEAFPDDALIIRQVESTIGRLHIATGGGPRYSGLSLRVLLANWYFVGISAALSLVLMVAIFLTLRSELRGIHRVAREAAEIGAEKRGMKLSENRLPTEIQPLVTAFNSTLQRLDEGMERHQRFMADAAHELRTPISILQMRIDLMPASAERGKLAVDVARLSNLADQLLDLQRIDIAASCDETVDLVALSQSAVADLAPLAISANSTISFESDNEQVLIRGDQLALSRVVANLIQNAIIHGGDSTEIDVAVAAGGTVTVSDSGPGIAPEQYSRIFEPFYRIHPSERGGGLGLNLVREIVHRHSGSIDVVTAKKGGASFAVTLPLVSRPSSPRKS